MGREQIPRPGQDGEERGSSPSLSSGTGKTGRKRPGGRARRGNGGPEPTGPRRTGRGGYAGGAGGDGGSDKPEPRVRPEPAGSERPTEPTRPAEPGRPTVAAGFAEGGPADVMAPGAELAELVAAVTGSDGAMLGTLTDQEVLGVLGAVRRMAASAAWAELVTLAEFARRRPATAAGSTAARAAAEEAAWKTTEQWTRMLDQTVHATAVTTRLPLTLAALGQGQVSDYKVRIIEAQTADLSADDVAKADVMLAAAAQVKNPAALRDYSRRQVARLDPEAAVRKKERGRRNAYVRAWQEDSGNMGLSAREMPNGDGQVAWQNIEARALDLHAAGVPGTTGQLQVQAMLDFLLGRAIPDRGACENTHGDGDQSACQDAHGNGDQDACENAHGSEDETASHQNGRGGGRGGWVCNPILVVPWDPSLGRPSGPAELPGYGLLDQGDTMDLLQAAGENPASRWCLTVTGPDGTAAAHGCVPGPRTLDSIITAGTSATSAMDLAAAFHVKLTPIAKGACDHAQAEPGYRPSRKLRHLVMARNTRCTAWGCGRPAAACDQDHTRPWDEGGITCECDLAPLCRHHHQVKQTQGWILHQPEPGVLVWTTPAGLTRTTGPSTYEG
jgi:hypothetical protein